MTARGARRSARWRRSSSWLPAPSFRRAPGWSTSVKRDNCSSARSLRRISVTTWPGRARSSSCARWPSARSAEGCGPASRRRCDSVGACPRFCPHCCSCSSPFRCSSTASVRNPCCSTTIRPRSNSSTPARSSRRIDACLTSTCSVTNSISASCSRWSSPCSARSCSPAPCGGFACGCWG